MIGLSTGDTFTIERRSSGKIVLTPEPIRKNVTRGSKINLVATESLILNNYYFT